MAIEVDNEDTGSNNNSKSATNTSPIAPPVVETPKTPEPTPAPSRPRPSFVKPNKVEINNTHQNEGNRTMNQNTISARQNYGMQRGATSQAMRKIVEVVDKLSEGMQDTAVKFQYSALDGENEGLLISSLVVSAYLANPGSDQKYVAFHTLLLAATAKGATTVEQQVQIGNQNLKYERLVVAADAYDAVLRARVTEIVQAKFPGYILIDADATVVPQNMDLGSEEAVRNVIANATTASSTLLSSMTADDAWVIDEDAVKKTFRNEIKSSWPHFTDLTGVPVRSDVVLEMSVLTGKDQNQNQGQNGTGEFQYNTSQARKLITQISGYIDLQSTPPAMAASFGAQQGNFATRAEDLKIYTARYVITNMDAPEEAPELPIILQGLATAQSLCNNNNWVSALVQQHKNGAQNAVGGVNIRDLSVIGLEVPQVLPLGFMGGELPKPTRLPLSNAMIGDAALTTAINTYIHPDLLISMDVPECGASSWMTSPLAAAARGDQNAIRDIFEAADLLTRGLFTEKYRALNRGSMPNPFYNDNMFVNLGYYLTPAGDRDIRDGDYLAVANATADGELQSKGELTTLNDWANLQANSEVDPMFRLSTTRDLQRNLFESMVITGRAVRITCNPTFPFALSEAVAEAGLVYDTKMGMTAPQGTTRMVPQYMRNLPTGLGNANGFAATGMRRTNGQGVVNNSFGRYANNNNRSGSQPGSGGSF